MTNVPPPPPGAQIPPLPKSKKWYAKKAGPLPVWAWLGIALVVVGVIGAATEEPAGDSAKDTATEVAEPTSEAPEATAAPEPEPEPEPVVEAPSESRSQANARESAESYLRLMAFSRQGLIEQLEFEGYPTADAIYGVDANNVDWNRQAALKAVEYLELMPFSRSGLIEQLVFEGFTQSQASYGVSQAGL